MEPENRLVLILLKLSIVKTPPTSSFLELRHRWSAIHPAKQHQHTVDNLAHL